jgi:DNA-binding transcriptional MerR regulator
MPNENEYRDIPERKQIKKALRDLGLSNRQIDALLRDGYKTLIGATAAENAELREQLEILQSKFN